jgi:ketol-acid reductoisomerase
MKIHYDATISDAPLRQRRLAVLGYGNQGRPQALNLRDSGMTVKIGLRPNSRYADQATADGLEVVSFEAATQWADVLMLLLPDEWMADVYEQSIARHLRPGQYLGFGHGLVIHAGWVTPRPDINVFLVAPKAQGRGVRSKFVAGSGIPALYSVHQDPSGDTEAIALAYAKAIGGGRVGVLPTTFKEETECDLFSEQVVLCGGLTALIKAAFDTLVENGFSPEAAYFECLYEVKLIGDLLHDRGITGMRQAISSTALFGDLTRGERVIDGHVRATMQQVLDEITSGRFAAEMKAEFEAGRPTMRAQQEKDYHHPIEATFRRLHQELRLP